ncbi:TPA: hypothetical protein ACHU7U_001498, partial [Streptococcus suis]
TEIKSTESVHKIRYGQSHILTCLVVSNDNFVGQGFLNKRFYTSGEPLVFTFTGPKEENMPTAWEERSKSSNLKGTMV